MNKELLRLLELIKRYNENGAIEEEFKSFADNFKEDETMTVKELIEIMETEMSYWGE